MTEQTPPPAVKPEDKIKAGFYQAEDGTFTSYIQIKKLPDEEAAKNAASWLGQLLLDAAASKKSSIIL